METVTSKRNSFIKTSMVFSARFIDIQYLSLESYLDFEEQKYYANCVATKRKDWLAGRYAAKKAVRHYLKKEYFQDIPLRDIVIKSNKKEGVMFLTPPGEVEKELCLNISHCGGRGVAILARGPVGVDIERTRCFRKEILNAFLTPKEQFFVERFISSEQDLLATLLWSFKESYLKALRKGLIIHPRTIEVVLDDKWQFQELRHNGQIVQVEGLWRKFDEHHFLTSIHIK